MVEDSEDNRRYLVDLLSGWGLEVREAADGAEALARCRELGHCPDAVLVDRLMPVMDGWAFLRAVRESHDLASLPVALVSAAPADPPAGFPDACRFDQAFLKPLDPDALAEWLRQRLGLEWVRGDPADPGPNLRLPIVFPDRERLGDFEAMMALGRVVALRRWADELARTDPRLGLRPPGAAPSQRRPQGPAAAARRGAGSVASPPAG